VGGVHGCCTTCERVLHRQIGGLGTIAREIEPILRPTPYFLKTSCYGGTYKGPRGPLVMALHSLGATDLSDAMWIAGEDSPGISAPELEKDRDFALFQAVAGKELNLPFMAHREPVSTERRPSNVDNANPVVPDPTSLE